MKKMRVGLFYGGPSNEHKVSLKTAEQVASNLDSVRYNLIKIKISQTGKWPQTLPLAKLKQNIDFAFIAIHGQFGEDGTLQALLESEGIPYSGSGILASSLAMDKFRSGLVVKALGILTPKTWLIGTTEIKIGSLPQKLVLKPNNSGSSAGVKIISKKEFQKICLNSLNKYKGWLVQEQVIGRELTVSTLGTEVLPPIEILSKQQFYNYRAKYTKGQSEHVINPKLSKLVQTRLIKSARQIHLALGCRAMSRSDFILSGNKIYYLETNTIPGLTATSLLPDSAKAAGIPFPKLLDKIIEYSL